MATYNNINERACPSGKHHWPYQKPYTTVRSIGEVKFEQCNECLAVRVTQVNIYYDAKKQLLIEKKKVTVVEPK